MTLWTQGPSTQVGKGPGPCWLGVALMAKAVTTGCCCQSISQSCMAAGTRGSYASAEVPPAGAETASWHVASAPSSLPSVLTHPDHQPHHRPYLCLNPPPPSASSSPSPSSSPSFPPSPSPSSFPFSEDNSLNYAAILDTAADVAKAMLHLHRHQVGSGDREPGTMHTGGGGCTLARSQRRGARALQTPHAPDNMNCNHMQLIFGATITYMVFS